MFLPSRLEGEACRVSSVASQWTQRPHDQFNSGIMNVPQVNSLLRDLHGTLAINVQIRRGHQIHVKPLWRQIIINNIIFWISFQKRNCLLKCYRYLKKKHQWVNDRPWRFCEGKKLRYSIIKVKKRGTKPKCVTENPIKPLLLVFSCSIIPTIIIIIFLI